MREVLYVVTLCTVNAQPSALLCGRCITRLLMLPLSKCPILQHKATPPPPHPFLCPLPLSWWHSASTQNKLPFKEVCHVRVHSWLMSHCHWLLVGTHTGSMLVMIHRSFNWDNPVQLGCSHTSASCDWMSLFTQQTKRDSWLNTLCCLCSIRQNACGSLISTYEVHIDMFVQFGNGFHTALHFPQWLSETQDKFN